MEMLDKQLMQNWMQYAHKSKDPPDLNTSLAFLDYQRNVMPMTRLIPSAMEKTPKLKDLRDQPRRSVLELQETASSTSRQVSCIICASNHALFSCTEFKRISVQDRWSKVKQHKLCFNCLTKEHNSNSCIIKGRCWQCGATHRTLLHNDSNGTTSISASRTSPPPSAFASSDRSTTSTSTESTVAIVHPPKR